MIPSQVRTPFKSFSSRGFDDDEVLASGSDRGKPNDRSMMQNLANALEFFLSTEEIQRILTANDRFRVNCIVEGSKLRKEQESREREIKLRDFRVPETKDIEWSENFTIPATQLGHKEEKREVKEPVKKKSTHEENLQILFHQRMAEKQ